MAKPSLPALPPAEERTAVPTETARLVPAQVPASVPLVLLHDHRGRRRGAVVSAPTDDGVELVAAGAAREATPDDLVTWGREPFALLEE